MERVALDVEGGHFGVADFDAFFVQIVVEFTANRKARLGRGRGDQLDDRQPARQGPTPPVLRDRAEQAVSLVEVHDGVGNEAYEKTYLGDYYKDLARRNNIEITPQHLASLVARAPARADYESDFPADARTAQRYAAESAGVDVAQETTNGIERARSFTALRGFSRIGGVLIGRDPETGAQLDIKEFD
jgi:hypothetical protein